MKKILASAMVLFSCAASFDALAGGNIDAGKALTDKYSCAACHGKDFNTPIGVLWCVNKYPTAVVVGFEHFGHRTDCQRGFGHL